jgi:hypothetical protein
VTLIVAFGLMPLLAVNPMEYVPAVPASGVPLITAVLGSSFSWGGSVPALRLTVGGGVPVKIGP